MVHSRRLPPAYQNLGANSLLRMERTPTSASAAGHAEVQTLFAQTRTLPNDTEGALAVATGQRFFLRRPNRPRSRCLGIGEQGSRQRMDEFRNEAGLGEGGKGRDLRGSAERATTDRGGNRYSNPTSQQGVS